MYSTEKRVKKLEKCCIGWTVCGIVFCILFVVAGTCAIAFGAAWGELKDNCTQTMP